MSKCSKYTSRKKRRVKLFLLGIILLVFTIFIYWGMPLLYSIPGLTKDNFRTYKKCISLLKRIDADGSSITVTRTGSVAINNPNKNYHSMTCRAFFLAVDYLSDREVKELFQPEEVEILRKLAETIKSADCVTTSRFDGFIIFAHDESLIFPTRPGVLFSINGTNPNNSSSVVKTLFSPFSHVCGNWYVSKKMHFTKWRLPLKKYSGQFTIIDCSATKPNGKE